MIGTFKEAEEYILDIPKFTKKNSPENTKLFLDKIGDISKDIPTIHIAGTNGKGSVCALLRDSYLEAGLCPGVFTSPHLVSIRERFTFGREMITEEEFLECFLFIYNKLKDEELVKRDYYPSYFEFLFFMAVVWFKKKKPDVLILETGLGGRLDATNSVSSPAICAITEIGFDHMEYLGDTIEKIAGEKAGIIKPGVPVVYVDKPVSGKVIRSRAEELSSPFIKVSENTIKNLARTTKGIDFSLESHYYENVQLSVNCPAFYQAQNAAVAFFVLEELINMGKCSLTLSDIKGGFSKMKWPGRMEEIKKGIFLDGAHNHDGIEAFLETVKNDGAKKRSLVYSSVKDKQVEDITGRIIASGLFDTIYTGCLSSQRACDISRLKECFKEYKGNIFFYDSVINAFDDMEAHREKDETAYAVGSLYLVGEIKEHVGEETKNDQF